MTQNPAAKDPSAVAPGIREGIKLRLLETVRRIVPGSPLNWETILLALSVALFPLFYLTLKNWTETWLVILAALSAYGIFKSRFPLRALFTDQSTVWLVVALAFPIIAIFVSIVIRGDLQWSLFKQNVELLNGPGRLFLAAVALLWLNYKKVRFLDAFQVVLAIGIIITLFFATTQQEGVAHRYTTALLDLCTFGQQIVLLGLIQFFLLVFRPAQPRWVMCLSVVSILLAAYMGINSGGRGGWIVVPPLLVIAALLYPGKKTKLLSLLFIATVAVGGILATNKVFYDRLTSIYTETRAWFEGDATAGGSGRLTIMAISWELIKDKPIKGYAHKHHLWSPVYQMDPSRYLREGFTYEETEAHRFTLCGVGEHNQYLHEQLMSGIFGLLALLLLLVVPLVVFLLRLRGSKGDEYAVAATGVAFVAAFMVFGLTQGPLSYKVIASFYGFVIAGLASYRPPSVNG
jgi:O-antigen ligase